MATLSPTRPTAAALAAADRIVNLVDAATQEDLGSRFSGLDREAIGEEVVRMIDAALADERAAMAELVDAARNVQTDADSTGGRDRTVHRVHVDALRAALARVDALGVE